MKNLIGILALLSFTAALLLAGWIETGGGALAVLLSAAALAVLALAAYAGNRSEK